MKIAHILLPTDLSEQARRAYARACGLAKETGAKITLLSVVEDLPVAPRGAPFAPPIGDPDAPAEAHALREALERERERLDADVAVEVDTAIGAEVGETVAWYANEHGCDIILMSTHGHSGLKRLLLGSVAEKILRHTVVPVLSIPPNE